MCDTETSTDEECTRTTTTTTTHHSRVACDTRLDPICSYTLTTLRLKQDKWQKMLATDEFRFIVLDWINNTSRRILIMTLSPSGHLIPKNAMSDLYHNYSIQRATTISGTLTTNDTASSAAAAVAGGGTAAATATAAASVAMIAAATLVALPPPSSSFATLDGVLRGKCAYFVRREIGADCDPLTAENFHSQILYGDLPIHSKIETLAILFDEVFTPLLECPANRKSWPDIVGKDLNARTKDIRNTLTEIKGKTNNRTILSLLVSPTIIEKVATHVNQGDLSLARDPKFRNLLEEMFINWTTQIHEIIGERSDTHISNASSSSSATSSSGISGHATATKVIIVTLPAQEITFWINRKQNLHHIHEQLRSTPHKTLAYILESIESAYRIPFSNVFKDLISAWNEAQDIALWLQPLLRQTSAFNALNFVNSWDLIAPLVHVLHLIWTNARYYRSTERMSVLLRCICNMLVYRASEDLDFTLLFHADADEGLQKITRTIEILDFFKSRLLEYKDKYSGNQNVLPPLPSAPSTSQIQSNQNDSPEQIHQLWRFSNEDVFGHTFDLFVAQLFDMRKIFEAAVSFQSLEKLEIGGLRGKFLTDRLRQIHEEFKVLFEEWTMIDDGIPQHQLTSKQHHQQKQQQQQQQLEATLNPKLKSLKRKQIIFFARMEILEKKLATILVQTFTDCHNWEQLAKLTLMFGGILQRRSIQPELQNSLHYILSIYDEELRQLETLVSEVLLAFEYHGLTAIPLEWNFPPIAGAMLWLEQHQHRCDALAAHELNEFVKGLLSHSETSPRHRSLFEHLQIRRNVLITKLSKLQLQIWDDWHQTIEKQITKGLDTAIMQRIPKNQTHQIDQIEEKSSGKFTSAKAKISKALQHHLAFNRNIMAQTTPYPCSTDAINDDDDEKMPLLDMIFSQEIFTLLKETKYLSAIQKVNSKQRMQSTSNVEGFVERDNCDNFMAMTTMLPIDELPESLLNLYGQRDEYWQRKIKLIKISEYYNGIRMGVRTGAELKLISHEISEIDRCIAVACETMTWRTYDLMLIEEIYVKSQKLFWRVKQTHSNLKSILTSIRRWSREPLHQRSLYGKNLLDLRHQQERLRARLLQCDETKILLNRLLIANFCLFFNYDEQNFEIYSRDLSVQEFLCEFPDEQRRKYNDYLASVDSMIYQEVRQSMLISLRYLHNEMTASKASRTTGTRATIGRTASNMMTEGTTVTGDGKQWRDFGVSVSSLTIPQGKHQYQRQEQQQQQQHEQKQEQDEPQPLPLTTASLPLFEVKLELAADAEIRFTPSFDANVENNFQQIVEQLLQDIIQTCNCMPRIVDNTALSEEEEEVAVDAEIQEEKGVGVGVAVEAQVEVEVDNTKSAKNEFEDKSNVDKYDNDIDKVAQRETLTKRAARQMEVDFTSRQRQRQRQRQLQRRQKQQHQNQSQKQQRNVTITTIGTGIQTAKGDDLQMLQDGIRNALRETIQAALAYAGKFNEFAYLWTQRQEDVLRATLNAARKCTTDDVMVSKGYAIMEAFKKEIDRYNDLHESIDQLDSRQCVNGWLAIDANPLKYALLNYACKWANLFKQWLLRYVQQTLKELNAFIAYGLDILQLHTVHEDFRTLLRILSIMAQIRERGAYADNIFKPLKDIISLLRTYNVEFDVQLMRNIDQLPLQWKHLKDVATMKLDALQSIRIYQQQRVIAFGCIFSCHVETFARKFEKMPFFIVPCAEVYALCDGVFAHLDYFTSKYQRISRWAKLLDIPAPESHTLHSCATEVKRIKQLWDFVRVIESCIVEWHATPWHRIDTDDMENECKKFTRDLRTLDKAIREWEPYVYIVAVLKDMVASLRAITELQNPAITERHWMELMQVTKLTRKYKMDYLLTFKCDENTTLKELLQLELHHYEEDIKNTVDRAIKEMTVTRILDEIKATWARMEFETEMHQERKHLKLLKVSEELIETLDDNQMQLQNIATSKHIEYLLDKLLYWQRALNDVDTLISTWFEVQRKWIYLEHIFIGSADIREQLPLEAERFEAIDVEFTQVLQEVGRVRVVIEVVQSHPQIFSILGELQQRLSVCEKALNDYLETKRLAFPRFYFISAADLLDILSNGNCPQVIDRHLIKLFDSLLRLEYETNTSHAIGMHSKENDEYVRFTAANCSDATYSYIECSGRVELWLNAVINSMRQTLRELLRRSLHAFIEKPRDQWLYDWPAQVALCCSQICWTSDVNRAFAWMEEGYEGAMKDLHKRHVTQLNALINLLLGELLPGDRQKIMTICIHDVHSRDVVSKIIQAKVDNSLAFQWQSQLRHRWDENVNPNCNTEIDTPSSASASLAIINANNDEEDCFANICDAEFRYDYEYLGNTSRLVITPLTDRCYITLTQVNCFNLKNFN